MRDIQSTLSEKTTSVVSDAPMFLFLKGKWFDVMKKNISSMTSFKWCTEFVRKSAEGIRSVNANVNGVCAVSVNMALSMFILEKHFFVVVCVIIFSDRNERTANSHIALTSMLFVKIPWAHTGVHVKLVIQEMENNVAVRTVSKKYRNMHFETHTIVFQ